MANRISEQTIESDIAIVNFSDWLKQKRREKRESQAELATAIDLERKSICAYEAGVCTPKLDVLAKLYAHYGENEINIRLYQ